LHFNHPDTIGAGLISIQSPFGRLAPGRLFVINFNYSFSIGQQLRAGRYKISHLQQYLPVVSNVTATDSMFYNIHSEQ